jgi:hypothetical protein
MSKSTDALGIALVLVVLVACQPETGTADSQETADSASTQTTNPCVLVDLELAARVIGEGTTLLAEPVAEMPSQNCTYQGPEGSGLLSIRVDIGRRYYDGFTIPEPHRQAALGDQGRTSVGKKGSVHVQFIKGDTVVTLQTLPPDDPSTDYMDSMLEIAEIAAGRLP